MECKKSSISKQLCGLPQAWSADNNNNYIMWRFYEGKFFPGQTWWTHLVALLFGGMIKFSVSFLTFCLQKEEPYHRPHQNFRQFFAVFQFWDSILAKDLDRSILNLGFSGVSWHYREKETSLISIHLRWRKQPGRQQLYKKSKKSEYFSEQVVSPLPLFDKNIIGEKTKY